MTPLSSVIRAFADGLKPEPDMTIDQWADKYRKLTSETSSEPGDWETERTPYLREIMFELSPQSDTEEVVFMKGSQVGGTEVGNNFIGYIIHKEPGPALMLHSTMGTAEDASVQRIDTMIETTPVLRERIKEATARKWASTRRRKKFPGGFLFLRGAKSALALRSTPIRFLFMDELDSFDRDVQGEGNPISLAVKRTATFARRKIFKVSTPTIKDRSHIEEAFKNSDQRHYHLPCPVCGHKQWLQWKGFIWQRDAEGRHLPETVKYQCEMCGDLIGEEFKDWMLANGEWIPDNPGHPVRGYHLSAFYSPLGLGFSWAYWVQDKLSCGVDPVKLKTWTNHGEARTWEEHAEEVDKNPLLDRLEDYRGAQVPAGGLVITVGIDVQVDRFEVVARAWGEGEESWLVEWKTIDGGIKDAEARKNLAEWLKQEWIHESGVKLPVAIALIDSGNQAKFVYDLVRVLRRQGVKISASKGSSHHQPEAIKKMKQKGGVPFFSIGTEFCKVAIYSRLNDVHEPGPGFYHFPEGTPEEYFNQLTAEKFRTKLHKGHEIVVWEKKSDQRNEVLDCEVLCLAGLTYLRPSYQRLATRLAVSSIGVTSKARVAEERMHDPLTRDAQRVKPRRGGYLNRWREV